MAEYTAIFGQAEDGTWSGYIPDLSCVIGMGTTLELCKVNITEALCFWVESMREKGYLIPPPSTYSASISAYVPQNV